MAQEGTIFLKQNYRLFIDFSPSAPELAKDLIPCASQLMQGKI